ncbi:MAG: hypothetical protein K0R57_2314 [Paenibacillaceae bacterium]|jgi:hypothetical protein|nr:hypothetical protein [Paenibacillaceae bacterium]
MRYNRYFCRLRRLAREDRGSFLIEASLTLPLLFLFTVVLLGVGLIAYQKSLFIQQSYEWSERTAYVWKDSHRDPVTGAFTYKNMDDIYATMISEGLGWLGASFNGFEQASIRLPDLRLSGQSLSAAKLLRSSRQQIPDISGQGSYYNRLLEGEVRARWMTEGAASDHSFLQFAPRTMNVEASSYYSDPVEFLRTADLIVTYAQKLKQRFFSPKEAVEELSGLLPKPAEKPQINSEAQAKLYLKQLLGSSGAELETSYGKRIIDVLDSDGIAHEAKYTINPSNIDEQILKDAELIRTGQVKGVVWHFFYAVRYKKYYATPALLKKLEENGIMVVYH